MTDDQLAVLACQRPTKSGAKRPDCPCPPCRSRVALFGANVPVQIQEPRRTALELGLIVSLHEKAPGEKP